MTFCETITLAVTSNENATCRFATVRGVAFSAMTNTFSTTGGTIHQHNLNNLKNEQVYDFYIRCKDGQNNSNQEDYYISFSVGKAVGQTGNIIPSVFLLLRN